MSRSGKKPITIPEKVKINVANGVLHAEGPMGKQQVLLNDHLKIDVDTNAKLIKVTQNDKSMEGKQAHGLIRSLIQNSVTGVSTGFKKVLDIEGIGYRAEAKGQVLNLTLGFSHPVVFDIPHGIKVGVEKQVKITVSGDSKNLVGQVAANIRGLRPPEPYKGKGIRYSGEHIQRKVGKAAATAGGAK